MACVHVCIIDCLLVLTFCWAPLGDETVAGAGGCRSWEVALSEVVHHHLWVEGRNDQRRGQAASAILAHEVEVHRSVLQMGADPNDVLREAAAVEAHEGAVSVFFLARSLAKSFGFTGGGSLPMKV